MGPTSAGSPLRQRVWSAVDRAARAQDESHALIAELRRVTDALRETIDDGRRLRDARAAASRRI